MPHIHFVQCDKKYTIQTQINQRRGVARVINIVTTDKASHRQQHHKPEASHTGTGAWWGWFNPHRPPSSAHEGARWRCIIALQIWHEPSPKKIVPHRPELSTAGGGLRLRHRGPSTEGHYNRNVKSQQASLFLFLKRHKIHLKKESTAIGVLPDRKMEGWD